MAWNVYLAGEIHSDWREQIAAGAEQAGLDVTFTSPVTDHSASDDVGVAILGEPFRWYHAVGLALVLGGIWLAERRND